MNQDIEQITEAIARLSDVQIAQLAQIMVTKQVAPQFEFLLGVEKQELLRREDSLCGILFGNKW